MGRVVFDQVVHRHAKLILSTVDVIEFLRVAGVCFLDRDAVEFLDEHLFGFVDADWFLERRWSFIVAGYAGCIVVGWFGHAPDQQ